MKRPVLLLIPGMLNTQAVWADVVAQLERQYPEIELRFAQVQTQADVPQMARDAWHLLADVEEDRRLTLCGFSMGGYVALEMLASPARKVQGLCLLDSSARSEAPPVAALREKTIASMERDFAQAVNKTLHFMVHPDVLANTPLLERIGAVMLSVGPDCAIRQNRAVMTRRDHRSWLTSLAVPSLVVCGREDKVTPPALSEELASLIPGAQLHWIEGAGHMTPMEKPQQIAELLGRLVGVNP